MAIEDRGDSGVWDPAPSTRVLVVDDHVVFAELLGLALSGEDGFEFVGRADRVTVGIRMVESLRPDIVVMDVRLGDGDGIAATAQLTRQYPGLRVIVLTAFIDADLMRRAADAGACALLPKDGALSEMMHALRTARGGGFVVHPRLLKTLVSGDVRAQPLSPLTQREQDVLQMLAAGLEANVIARELGISLNTCRGYVKTLLLKLNAHSQLEAVVVAMRNGLIRVGAE
jgi:DNA-binding NarL/FixJ family response regulator